MKRMLPVALCLVALAARCHSGDELPPNLTNGLVLSLLFNGNGLDSSGLSNNASAAGIIFTNNQVGFADSAAHFSGVSPQYVDVPDAQSLHNPYMTFACWIRTAITNQVMQIGLKARYPDSAGEQWTVYIDTLNYPRPTLVYGIKRNSSGRTGAGWNFLPYGPLTLTNQWLFLAATWDGAVQKLYLNGTNVARSANVSPGGIDDVALVSDIQIGRSTVFPYLYNGDLDGVKVYNRALATNEIQELYKLGKLFQPVEGATAVSRVDNGFVVEIDVTDPGYGYTNAPQVTLVGGGGTNASAVATISNDGFVTSIDIINPGSGYTNAPQVVIEPPVQLTSLSIRVKTIELTMHLVVQRVYVVETSTDLQNWTRLGDEFVAQSDTLVQSVDVGSANTYFRLRDVTANP